MNYFLEMDAEDFIPQYVHSRENDDKEKLWILYSNMFPDFDEKTFMTFEQFYNKYTGKDKQKKILPSNGKTDEERIVEAEEILFKMEFVEKS